MLCFSLVFPETLGAAQKTEIFGPLQIIGNHSPMMGPSIKQTVLFEESGWIRSITARVLDADKTPLEDESVWCHSSFRLANRPNGFPAYFVLADGLRNIHFPRGFGLPIRKEQMYSTDSMLQSDGPAKNGRYHFRYTWDIAGKGSGQPLRDLEHFRVHLKGHDPEAVAHSDAGPPPDWWVNPGEKKVYEAIFEVPYAGSAHYFYHHLHHFASNIMLEDLQTGEVLFDEAIEVDDSGSILKLPIYSSVEGFAVGPGKRFRARATYNNTSPEKIDAMASLYLFVHRSEPF